MNEFMHHKSKHLYSGNPNSVINYWHIIRNHLLFFSIVSSIIIILFTIYAFTTPNVYQAQIVMKATKPDKNLLDESNFESSTERVSDRFIANEIEAMKNSSVREQVAKEIKDSINTIGVNNDFSLLVEKHFLDFIYDGIDSIKSISSIAEMLFEEVTINQKLGLDFIEILVSSTSSLEASLIANIYAKVYSDYNITANQKQLTRIKSSLKQHKDEKYDKLIKAEEKYKSYKLKGGIVQLDEQARSLIEKITRLESQANSVAIEMHISKEILDQYKTELGNRNLTVSRYLENQASEPYLLKLQEQIADIETQRDLAISSSPTGKNNSAIVKNLDERLNDLKEKLYTSIDKYKASILTASPEEIRTLTNKIFEEKVKYNSLSASFNQLTKYLKKYNNDFNTLPTKTMEIARLERERKSAEKLYLLIEARYQEAFINEQSTPGNVYVLNYSKPSESPSGPNRPRIIILGIFLGLAFGAGIVIVRNSLSNSIKSPDELEDDHHNLLGWIPQLRKKNMKGKLNEIIITNNLDTFASDSFKSIRTILNISKNENESKSFLITSSIPAEGKSFIATNLAGCFAQLGYKTLVIDCDLRKPRIHSIFAAKRIPGLNEFILNTSTYEEVLRKTPMNNLSYISAGNVQPNPIEIIDTKKMEFLISGLKKIFDIIIVDSPPLASLADSIILSRYVDETIIVVKSHFTEIELLDKSIDKLKKLKGTTFKGTIFNGFNYKKNYGSFYHKYTYTYGDNGSNQKSKKIKNQKFS